MHKMCSLKIQGTPTAPERFRFTERTKSSITLSWKPPQSDGGSPIRGYYVEKKRKDGTEFEIANRQICKDLFLTLDNLSERHMYDFRVKAVNDIGDGEPSLTLSAVIQDDEGIFYCSVQIDVNWIHTFFPI